MIAESLFSLNDCIAMMFFELLYPRKFDIFIQDLVMGVLSLVPRLDPFTPDRHSIRHAQ